MATGDMTQRVTIQRESDLTLDTRGQIVSAPLNVATVWAQIRPLAGDELSQARALAMQASHEVTIRYSSDVAGIRADYWLIWGAKRLDISGVVNPDNRNEWLVLSCGEQLQST